MKNNKWLCMLLFVAALAAGFVLGWLLRGPRTLELLVSQGKVAPSPKSDGEVLHWTKLDGTEDPVMWAGPLGFRSPCAEDEARASATCTIKVKPPRNGHKPSLKMYHYICPDKSCPDPTVPAPYSTGKGSGFGILGYIGAGGVGGGIGYTGQAEPHGDSTGVWYFPNDGTAGGFSRITVATYSADSGKADQVTWEPAGGSWKVVVLDGTCKGGSIFTDGNSTCTVLPGAVSQNYCVILDGYSSGGAVLLVAGGTTSPINTPPQCSLP